VDGVSGLNVLTGIIAKVFYQQLFEVGRPSILSLAGKSVIGLQTMLSYRPFGRRGVRRLSQDRMIAISFLKNFEPPPGWPFQGFSKKTRPGSAPRLARGVHAASTHVSQNAQNRSRPASIRTLKRAEARARRARPFQAWQ
jgi:hypothetical protein